MPVIRTLPVELGRIVGHREEDLQQPAVADLSRIVGHLHRFGMTGPAGAHHFVVGGLLLAAGITGDGVGHALHVLEHALHAPEAAAGEDDGGGGRLAWREVNRGQGQGASPFRARPSSFWRPGAAATSRPHQPYRRRKRSKPCVSCQPLAKSERIYLDAGCQESDLERMVADDTGLPDQLIQTLFADHAIARRRPRQTRGSARGPRRQSSLETARACRSPSARAPGAGLGRESGRRSPAILVIETSVLVTDRPEAGESPFVRAAVCPPRRHVRRSRTAPPGDDEMLRASVPDVGFWRQHVGF